jgi:hypothetical protein
VTAVLGALGSVVLAVLLAVAAFAGAPVLAAAVGVVVLALAAGWGTLLDLPDPRGTGVVVGASGLVAAAAAVDALDRPRPLAVFAALLALSVLAAFAHELLRRGGRVDLVESVTGTLCGQVLAVLGAGWVLVPSTGLGERGVLVAAAAVAGARLASALPWPVRITGWVGFVTGTAAAALAARVLVPEYLAGGAVTGLAVAAVVAGLDRLLAAQPAAGSTAGLVAAAAAPVAAVGTVAYAVARFLGA